MSDPQFPGGPVPPPPPPPGATQPPAPPQYATPAPAQSPVYSGSPAPSGLTPGGALTPPPPSAGGGGKMALIAGGVGLLVVVGALFFFFRGGDEPQAVTPAPPPPQDQQDPVDPAPADDPADPGEDPADPGEDPVDPAPVDPAPQDEPTTPQQEQPQEPPSGGGLGDVIPAQVGPYQATNAAQVPELIEAGAIDAIAVEYQGNGVQLGHLVAVFGDAATAQAFAQGSAQGAVDDGFQLAEQVPVQNQEGEVLGEVFLLTNGQADIIVWHNQVLAAIVAGPSGAPAEFYQNVPY